MSDTAAKKTDTPKTTDAPKKKPLPLIIGAVILLLVLAIGAKSVLGSKSHSKEKKAAPEVGIEMPLEEFLVNLNGGEHYLKATISLGLKKGLTEEEAKHHLAPMRDAILVVLGSKTLKDLNELKDRDALKEELKTKINAAAPDEPVVKVYFTAFATQ